MAQIKRIKVGVASCGVAAGAEAVLEALKRNAGEIPVVGVVVEECAGLVVVDTLGGGVAAQRRIVGEREVRHGEKRILSAPDACQVGEIR